MADEIEPEPEKVPGSPRPPLWLPEGSIRGIIAIVIVATTCGLVFSGVPIPEWFMLSFTGVIAAYYTMRNNSTK